MKSTRRRSREFALQGLYQRLVSGNTPEAIAAHLATTPGFDKADAAYFNALLKGCLAEGVVLEAHYVSMLDRPVEEISPIERSILLLGTFELAHMPDVPYRVVINESVELAKSFGGTDGHKFVNGVLDKLAPELRAAEVKAWPKGEAAPARMTAAKAVPKTAVKLRRKIAPA